MVQEELKRMILEEALASGQGQEDAEKVAELVFVRWTEVIERRFLTPMLPSKINWIM
jgi:hypothetical protein